MKINTNRIRYFIILSMFTILLIGAVYTRYGQNYCPNSGARKIYDGMLAGNTWSTTGGASDYLCLPHVPQYATSRPEEKGYALLEPGEYQFPVKSNANNFNVPCAVCESARSNTVMIPARISCYPGWAKEYQGHLMTQSQTDTHSTKYICVDGGYGVIIGTGGDTSKASALYNVKVDCSSGGFSCNDRYYNNRAKQITCVVCTK